MVNEKKEGGRFKTSKPQRRGFAPLNAATAKEPMKEPEYCEALEKTLDVSEVVLTKAPQAAQDTFKNLKMRTAEFWHLGAKTANIDTPYIETEGTEFKQIVDDSGMFKKFTKKKHGLVRRVG